MSAFNSKAKMAYFKDNVQSPDEQEDFDVHQYYYTRESLSGSESGVDSSRIGTFLYGPGAAQAPMHPGMMRAHSAPNPQLEGYPTLSQQPRPMPHGIGSSPNRGSSGGAVPGSGPSPQDMQRRDAFNVMDPSNFPVLNANTSRHSAMGGVGYSMSMGSSNHYLMDGAGSNNSFSLNQQSNFSILNEDFPALPSSNGPGARSGPAFDGQHISQSSIQSGGTRDSIGIGPGRNSTGAVVGPSRSVSASPVGPAQGPTVGMQLAGSRAATGGLSGGASGMQLQQLVNGASGDPGAGNRGKAASIMNTKDSRYGLLGLLDVIKMTDRDLNTLALGTDLTTFGLNLSSTESLYLTFSSPYSDVPAPPEVPFFSTPGCYLMQPPSLKPDHLNKMQIETLFYMFYSMPRDQLQTAAAVELYRRDWRFHADLRLWMKHRPPAEPQMSAAANQSQFIFFEIGTWEARVYTGSPLRTSGFLSEEDIVMSIKNQQGSPSLSVTAAQAGPGAPVNQALQSMGPVNSDRVSSLLPSGAANATIVAPRVGSTSNAAQQQMRS